MRKQSMLSGQVFQNDSHICQSGYHQVAVKPVVVWSTAGPTRGCSGLVPVTINVSTECDAFLGMEVVHSACWTHVTPAQTVLLLLRQSRHVALHCTCWLTMKHLCHVVMGLAGV